MVNDNDLNKDQVLDKEVAEFLTSVESIKTEVGEFKQFIDKSEDKQQEIEDKLTDFQKEVSEKLEGFIVKFNEVVEDIQTKQKNAELRRIPNRDTQIGSQGDGLSKEDALEAGLRSILLATLDPDVKEVVLMPDLKVHKPSIDPYSYGYNMNLYREVATR